MLLRESAITIVLAALIMGGAGCERSGRVEVAEEQGADRDVVADQGGGKMEKATFAAGCFWGVEAAFRQVKGVKATEVGYSGGSTLDPTYKEVCTDTTGHAESVEVAYDPAVVSYEQLLDVFWGCHNPTQLNRQGPDVGTQYRSVIFFHNEKQKETATASMDKLAKSGKYSGPIVTEILPAPKFYKAEDYHQQYLEKRGLSECHIN